MFAALTLTLLPVPHVPTPERAGAAKALPLLAKAATGHAEQKSCFACHNQAPSLMAHRAAGDQERPRGHQGVQLV